MSFGATDDPKLPAKRVGGVDVRLISEEDDLAPLDPDCGKHGELSPSVSDSNGVTLSEYADGTERWEFDTGGGVLVKDGKVIGWWYTDPEADARVDARFARFDTDKNSHVVAILAGNVLTANPPVDPTSAGPVLPRRDLYGLYAPEVQDGGGPLAVVLGAGVPRDWNDAAPETDPNLPNPLVPANPDGSACVVGCRQP